MKKITLLSIIFICTHHILFSQNQTDTITNTLQEVEVSANRIIEKKNLNAQQILLIPKEEMQTFQSQTTADVLQKTGNIFVQQSQQGGGSPVIRGFEASRILLVIDGIRMNNLIYRTGHLQNIITTDNTAMDKIEVIYGPSSTIYGSDALGGVIHMYTKQPQLSGDSTSFKLHLNAFSRYGNVNNEFTNHVDFNLGCKKLASFTSLTYFKFGDLRMGTNQNPFYSGQYPTRPFYVKRIDNKDSMVRNSDKYLQIPSGYDQYNIIQKFLWQNNPYSKHIINIQYTTSSDIPRYDRLSEYQGQNLRFSEWYYGPQKHFIAAYDFNYSKSTSIFDYVRVVANYQSYEESRHTRRFKKNELQSQIENVNVYGFNIDVLKKWNKHHIQYGIDIQANTLISRAYEKDITTNNEKPFKTRYPDGDNKMMWGALYWYHKYFINGENWILTDGFRIGYAYLHSTFKDTTFFKFPFNQAEQKNITYSGNIGIIHNIGNEWKLAFLISSGFRVPNVDDLGKVFDSQPGAVIVPNPNIQPEKTLTEEISITKFFNKNSYFENTIYYTQIFDGIVTDKFQYNGQDSIIYNGVKSIVLANQNKQKAYIYGFYSQLKTDFDKHFSITLSVNYTFGRIKTDSVDYPLDHIPPLFSKLSFLYKPSEKLKFSMFLLYNGQKKISDYNMYGEDNFQYATPIGMPAWATLNFRIEWAIGKHFTILTGIDNIFDTQYRTFSSGINAPGRDLFVTLKMNI
ncbi:MAG: TonB-dependent receptor [Bacteroidia bacterium]|nr:TonB-dependent receptor [Bacteroidia bacterium]